ncbi:ABC-type transporter Mla subunit MlaD [Cytobacillus eiseniae]|uniref:ABC-type transporter Mla subunit MlaD n=1 Tax=Cytobacillus eiseniae TaxID=762947 RepID=A0ABS4REJ3_9BACI|nr:hypothetical protein [Cytobacillus eiseniae]MBP2241321.1 ABC-type transporter Mla subunit MlaD [Cytobacillus eiseniae]
MYRSKIDFNQISQSLSDKVEALMSEQDFSASALEQLQKAQNELQQALSYSLSSLHK